MSSLAKCLQNISLDADDEERIKALFQEHQDAHKAVSQLSKELDRELEGLRSHLIFRGHPVQKPSMSVGGELAAAPRGPIANAPVRASGGTPAAPASSALTRLMDVSNRLVDALGAIVRQGRISNPKALGIYKVASGAIRVRKPDDFDVLTHELGHHLEESIGAPVKALMKQHSAELVPMAYAGAKKGTELKEGFAEYVRLAMTNPAYAQKTAPNFDQAFRAAMKEPEYAELGQAMDEAAKAYRAWLDQPSTEAVRSTIVSSKEPSGIAAAKKKLDRYGLGHTIADYLSRGYTSLLSEQHPLSRATRALAFIYKDNFGKLLDLKVADDPAKLARMSRGAWNAGHVDITSGVHPYRVSKPASPSLRDAIILAMAKPNVLSGWDNEMAARFGGYLWSRRALGEWDRFDQGLIPNPPDKLTKGDHLLNVQEMETKHPQFRQAADMVHQWASELWKKKRDAGLITHEQWQDGLNIRDYVPGHRVFDQNYDPLAKGKAAKSSKGGFVKRFQGSRRDVINPLDSLVRDAYETSMAISRNDVVKSLDRLATVAGPGGGHIAERIPAKEIRSTIIDPLEAVESAAKASGMAKQDVVALRDAVESMIGDEKAAIFRPAIINEKGEPIVFFRDGGELRALRLADGEFGRDMYRAFTGMTGMQQNIWVNMLAKSSAVFRLGIVADLPFMLANFIRDQGMGFVLYGKPLQRLAGTARGMVDDLFVTDAAREYNHAQGIMGGAGVATLHDVHVNRDISELKKQGWAGSRLTSLQGIMSLTEISETGTRLSLFKTFKREALKRGLSEYEALMEASWRARDYIDYNRHGSQMAALSRLIPFLNANIQGVDKFIRHTIVPYARWITGNMATTEDARALGEATKSWARISALTMLSMGLYALNSEHDEFRDLNSQSKGTNWWYKWGDKWLSIPKPFEVSAIINLGEAAYDAAIKRDPRWGEQYLETLKQAVLPPNLLEGNPAIKTAFELKTGTDVQTGQAIVPDELKGMEPWLQYTSRTSQLAKSLGRIFNEPPELIDHLIMNQTGSYGRNLLALYDWALSDKPSPGWDDMPFTRRFIKDASRGSSSSRAFWDLVSQQTGSLEGAFKSWKAMQDGGDTAGAQDYLAKLDDNSKVWIAASTIDSSARSIHPFIRARHAVQAISQLRRDMMDGNIQTSDGLVSVPRIERGAADDILADLSMAEMRNALVVMGVPGWKGRDIIDNSTYHNELKALSPTLFQALADRYASAGTHVLPFSAVQEMWPDLEERLKQDGSQAFVGDLHAMVKGYGTELEGEKIKREKRVVPSLETVQ